jgi:hypothetical protein
VKRLLSHTNKANPQGEDRIRIGEIGLRDIHGMEIPAEDIEMIIEADTAGRLWVIRGAGIGGIAGTKASMQDFLRM